MIDRDSVGSAHEHEVIERYPGIEKATMRSIVFSLASRMLGDSLCGPWQRAEHRRLTVGVHARNQSPTNFR
jgi:hypothetical protein